VVTAWLLFVIMRQVATPPTCGDADGSGNSTAAFDCGQDYTAKAGVANFNISGLTTANAKTACCQPVSAQHKHQHVKQHYMQHTLLAKQCMRMNAAHMLW
jgi:hypothetical protein